MDYSLDSCSPLKDKFTLPARCVQPKRISHYTTLKEKNGDIESLIEDRIALGFKQQRLKTGLKKDTANSKIGYRRRDPQPIPGYEVVFKGRLIDLFRKRLPFFRRAIQIYGPPYYSYTLGLYEGFESEMCYQVDDEEGPDKGPQSYEADGEGNVRCVWCDENVNYDCIGEHKMKECSKRRMYFDRGYYECAICKTPFIDHSKAAYHVTKHFPKKEFNDGDGNIVVHFRHQPTAIICRDQAKRNKWI